MEKQAGNVADRMARLVRAVERSRTEPTPHPRRTPGEELMAVLELADQFPKPAKTELRYPVLKRLLAARE